MIWNSRSIYILFFQMGYIQLFSEYIPMILAITISVYSLSERSIWCVFFSNDSILLLAKGYRREGYLPYDISASISSICFFLSCRTYTSLTRRKYTPKKLSTELRETYEEKHACIRWEKVNVIKSSIYLNKSSIYCIIWRSKKNEFEILVTIKLIDTNRYILVYLAFVSLSQQLFFLDKKLATFITFDCYFQNNQLMPSPWY